MKRDTLRYRLLEAQLELARRQERAVVLLLTGHAATHKGQLVNALNRWLENRHTEVHALAPSSEEQSRPYWWRYWRRVPERGRIGIFIHGWHGDALFARAERRLAAGAFEDRLAQIRHFEERLLAHGGVLIKLFLAISRDEQLRRFEDRAATPHKRHKLTAEDWRNREHWDDYHQAIDAMFSATHRPGAEWTLVAGDDKRRARLAVLEAVNERQGYRSYRTKGRWG
ncbi:polyphosphate kinase 2 family protein [Halomonas sp. PBN3]|uniref:polyphosphate kinase 2 family protein n=1 Tax=Halomonas sp. PBN3 TaxID=1397528 RepID=UPI0003B7F376|nr:hypothetical protein [Halomonas sp. PBN3]ERS87702.1 hypothetical protein Q671_01860 [Halomonas sp. PBN3]